MQKILCLAVFILNVVNNLTFATCSNPFPKQSITTKFFFDHLYTYSIVDLFLLVRDGTPVPFNGPDTSQGDVITKINETTFLIRETGHYLATFSAQIAVIGADIDGAPLEIIFNPGVEFQLNGVSQGYRAARATRLILNQILDVTAAPSFLQVVPIQTDIVLDPGTTATLSIVQL